VKPTTSLAGPARPAATSRGARVFSALTSPVARLPLAAALSLAAAATLQLSGARYGHALALTMLVVTGAPIVWRTVRGTLRGVFAADIVASLAIVGAAVLQQPLAGLVIVLMQSGGELLERYAEGRASGAVRHLEAQAPQLANRISGDRVESIRAGDVEVGDRILVRPGEMVPCDGLVTDGTSHLEVARLTGEPSPERVRPGDRVRSGAVNIEQALTVDVTARASESLYSRIVAMVRDAQASKSPTQRLADRYAIWFTPLTLVACAIAWGISHDATRVLAVLVVATPCPLILATPVAIIGGINRAARHQIVVRSGSALEAIARADVAVFDKTGTLTIGYPEVARAEAIGALPHDQLVRLAAAVELNSGHLLARSVVAFAEQRGLVGSTAQDTIEAPGSGITGMVDGRRVSVGSLDYVSREQPGAAASLRAAHTTAIAGEHGLRAFVAVDDAAAGVLHFADRTRDGLSAFFADLTALGIRRTILVSGDHGANVSAVARAIGITDARGDVLPDGKVEIVRSLEALGHRVVMTGDGTNDAPALSAASVGVAIAAHGGGISAEAAGIVLLADDVTRLATAIRIGRRATRIAKQGIVVGLGLSLVAMAFAFVWATRSGQFDDLDTPAIRPLIDESRPPEQG